MKENKEHNIVCIIQARMGSTRLPEKSMMLLAGKPLVDHVMERTLEAKEITQVVIAIPETPENDVIADRANRLGVNVFRGSEGDLLGRYYQAAKQFGADIVVRVCADNPLIQPQEVDRIIRYFLEHDFDFVSNVGPVMGNNYPDGLGAEVFSFDALQWLFDNMTEPRFREHVHEGFYENQDRFQLGTVACPKEIAYPDIVLDINTKEEYQFIAKLFDELQTGDDLIDIRDIIPWYQKNRGYIPETYKRQKTLTT